MSRRNKPSRLESTLSWREFAEMLVEYIETEIDERIEVVYASIRDETQARLPWEDGEDEEDETPWEDL